MSSDRETTRRVRSWLEEGVVAVPDRILDAVLDQLPTTPQHRRLSPVRRFSDMSTTARLLVAAALVALGVTGTAIVVSGGIGPVATNSPPGSTPSAATGTPGTRPTATGAEALPTFTACVPSNTQVKTGTSSSETIEGPNGPVKFEQSRGDIYKGSITATDARFSGTHYYSWNSNNYLVEGAEEGQGNWAEGHRIENADGAWQGTAVGAQLLDGTEAGGPIVLFGEGAYDGLTAVLFMTEGRCFFNFRGLVMEVAVAEPPYTGP